MKTKLIASAVALSALSLGSHAQQTASTIDRAVLPVPLAKFKGKIGVSLKDSKSEWPEPLKTPKGAPNVPTMFSADDTFDVGEDWGTPLAHTYECPFKFTGTMKSVTIEVRPSDLSPAENKAIEAERAAAIANED